MKREITYLEQAYKVLNLMLEYPEPTLAHKYPYHNQLNKLRKLSKEERNEIFKAKLFYVCMNICWEKKKVEWNKTWSKEWLELIESHKNCIHNNPEDYWLSEKEVLQMKRRFLIWKIIEEFDWINVYEIPLSDWSDVVKNSNELLAKEHIDLMNKYIKSVYFVTKRMHKEVEDKSFDVERIKEVPIENFVEINNQWFFRIRDEKTPSCKYYKDKNTWHDFGSGKWWDVISLIMEKDGVSFREACKIIWW